MIISHKPHRTLVILLESKGRIVRSNQKIHTQEHQDEPKRCTAMDPGKSSTKIWSLENLQVMWSGINPIQSYCPYFGIQYYHQHESLDHQRALKGDSRPSTSWTLQGTCYWFRDPSVVVQKVEESESPLRTQNVPRHVWTCASHTSLAPKKCVPPICLGWWGGKWSLTKIPEKSKSEQI